MKFGARNVSLLLAFGLCACAPESITIAHEGDEDAAAIDDIVPDAAIDASEVPTVDRDAGDRFRFDARIPGGSCFDNTGCPWGMFCQKQRCGDVRGSCASLTNICGDGLMPVCGCDGISYFNDCIRKRNGVAAATSDMCSPQDARRCSLFPGDGCPTNSVCAFVATGGRCDAEGVIPQGQCWSVPSACPLTFGGDLFASCATNSLGEHDCVSACEALSSGRPYLRVDRCQPGSRDRPEPYFGP